MSDARLDQIKDVNVMFSRFMGIFCTRALSNKPPVYALILDHPLTALTLSYYYSIRCIREYSIDLLAAA